MAAQLNPELSASNQANPICGTKQILNAPIQIKQIPIERQNKFRSSQLKQQRQIV